MLDPSESGSKQGALPWRAGVSQEAPSPLSPLPPFGAASRRSEWTVEGAYRDWELVRGSCPPPRQTRGGGVVSTWLPLLLSGGPSQGHKLLSKLLMGR